MNNILIEKSEALSGVFANETFKAEAQNLKTVEDLQELLAKYDVVLTKEEVSELCTQIAESIKSTEDGELNEDALENVTGGGAAGFIILGVVCIGAFALGVYNAL